MLNPRKKIHQPRNLSQRIADGGVSAFSTFKYIFAQTAFIIVWACYIDFLAPHFHWTRFDTPQLIGLNLLLSIQASMAAPLILAAQKRQSQRDHLRDNLEAKEVEELLGIQHTQLDILEGQNEVLEGIHALAQASHELSQKLHEHIGEGSGNHSQ